MVMVGKESVSYISAFGRTIWKATRRGKGRDSEKKEQKQAEGETAERRPQITGHQIKQISIMEAE
jgi:hypothetical protein